MKALACVLLGLLAVFSGVSKLVCFFYRGFSQCSVLVPVQSACLVRQGLGKTSCVIEKMLAQVAHVLYKHDQTARMRSRVLLYKLAVWSGKLENRLCIRSVLGR